MKKALGIFLAGICASVILVAIAAEPAAPPPADVPPPPPMPKKDTPAKPESDTDARPESGLEADITIVTKGETRFEEHRIHGHLYYVKVIPKTGKPYYLIDRYGNGEMARSDLEPKISVPMWIIKSW